MRFEIQGHRGARGLWPENTLSGFRAAAALGVDTVELDVAVTADGVAVVFHDAALTGDIVRGPDGRWLEGEGPLLRSLTLAELSRYDVGRLRPGTAYAAAFPAQLACDGARIPVLADVFAATVLPAAGTVRVDAELKTWPDRPALTVPAAEMADRVLAAAGAAGALGRLDVRSFDWRGLRHVRARQPGVTLTFLTAPAMVAVAALWWDGPTPADHGGSVPRTVAAEAPGSCWAPAHHDLTRARVDEARALGLRVVPWTVNDPGDMARLMRWGVHGICTDRPDLARMVVERVVMERALPPAAREG